MQSFTILYIETRYLAPSTPRTGKVRTYCVVIQALTCCVTEREEQWRRGRERRKERKSVLLRQSRQSRRTRREYEVAGALCFFCTNATSGIMRRRRLMCESRKEQSDGIAIATKSIASSCPARRALPNGRWGKHVRKGDIFLICSHLVCKKKALRLGVLLVNCNQSVRLGCRPCIEHRGVFCRCRQGR